MSGSSGARVRAADASCRGERRAVEYLTRVDAPGHKLLVGGLNVGDDQPTPERAKARPP